MTRVAIIGGGIGGLTAAIALSRAGVEVAVYEAAAELREIGAGVALHPNAMRVLRAIGAEEGVRKIAGRSDAQVLRNGVTGKLIAATSRGEQWLGPHGTVVLYPLRGEELINVVAHYNDDSYRHESWVARCERAEVLDRYAGWHESLLRLFGAGDTWYKWALYDRDPIPAWTRGRVTLLGDSAHPMLPYLGQGACQAIEDGAVLATALATAACDPPAALGRYERTRRPRASRVVLTARERGRSNHLTSPLAAWRRDLAIAWRKRVHPADPEGRGTAWLAEYDATSPGVLVP